MSENMNNSLFWSEHWSIDDDDKAWMFSAQFNALCCVDLNDNHIRYIGRLPLLFEGERQYSHSICVGDNIYFFPDKSNRIVVYHKYKGEFSTIDLSKICTKSRLRCTDSKLIDGKIWVFSSWKKMFICVNPLKDEIDSMTSLGEDMQLWDYEIGWTKNNAYITRRDKPALLRFNIKTKSVEEFEYKHINDRFRTIQVCDDVLCVSGESGNLYFININDMKYRGFLSLLNDRKYSYPYLYSCYLNKKLWMIPREAHEIAYIDITSKETGYLEVISENKGAYLGVNYIRDGRYIGVSRFYGDDGIKEIDSKEKLVKSCEYVFDHKEKCKMMKDINEVSSAIFKEDRFYGIKEFLRII